MLLAGMAYGAALVLDVADLRPLDLGPAGVAAWSLNLVASLAFMTVLFLGEEIGWRGYLLPRVQQLTSRRRAALVTGFVHGCFHLPLILIATTYDEFGSRWFVAPIVVATITMGGIFYAYLWDRTGTVWPVAMAHGAVNIAFGIGAGWWSPARRTTSPTSPARAGSRPFSRSAWWELVLLARAKVWRTERTPETGGDADPRARRLSPDSLAPVVVSSCWHHRVEVFELSGGRAASASESSPVVEPASASERVSRPLPRGCRSWVVEIRSDGERYGAGVAVRSPGSA